MAFTDDDLERLRKHYSGIAITIPVKNGFVDGWALLARLEAAEKCMLDHINLTGDLQANYEAWRKAAGK